MRLKELVRSQWGKLPVKGQYDKIDSVSGYWINKLSRKSPKYFIDKITWNDLNMDDVFKRINVTFSSVGAEYLYARLHEPSFRIEELNSLEQLMQSMEDNVGLREKISFALAKLGKKDYNNVHEFLFSPEERRLHNSFIFPVLAALPVASLLMSVIDWRYTIYMLIVTSIINGIVYYKNKSQFEAQLESIRYITSIVVCSGELARLRDDKAKEHFDGIAEGYHAFKKIVSFANVVLSKPVGDMAFLLEYIKIAFMTDFISYNRIVGIISKNSEGFQRLWMEIGKFDMAICVASYRHSVDLYTAPVFVEDNELNVESIYHPLIEKPVVNPVTLTRNAIITGSNASGKSTYVKAVAINSIFAQTIHTCLAEKFYAKLSFVITSMAVNDNVIEGDSYFIAEMKSLKRIINTINEEVRCLCFIDEILKGTNTIERIAASAAILKWLSGQNCLCIVASHDIELTDILKGLYNNYHFREQIAENGIHFDYKIYNGCTTTRNAIKLLEFMKYPDDIISDAQLFTVNFEGSGKWNSYSQNGDDT
jgi:hypothetical protein